MARPVTAYKTTPINLFDRLTGRNNLKEMKGTAACAVPFINKSIFYPSQQQNNRAIKAHDLDEQQFRVCSFITEDSFSFLIGINYH
jgi:hypothetical protein